MIDDIAFGREGVALVMGEPRRVITYAELGERVEGDRRVLRDLPQPALVFMFCPNRAGAVAAYLACLAEKIPLGLGEPSEKARKRVIDAYEPTAVLLSDGESAPEGYVPVGRLSGRDVTLFRRGGGAYRIQPNGDLALLLATSGSTGDSKFVRLSRANLKANARSIASYLALGPDEIAIQSLPMHYSYGLSVLNSHLIAGGALALTDHSFMRPEFWQFAEASSCTSFAGVPYMYETLYRLRMSPTDIPGIRTMTQAGGHLNVERTRHFHERARKKGARLFVMYGQTEATARMSYVPPDRLTEKLGSIGVPIPGGKFWLEVVDDAQPMHQLCYQGPNVMLGYASGPDDLARGDDLGGILATGDLAECDSDGFFRITGRLARFAKLFGKRINLAGVESEIEERFFVRTAVVDGGDILKVYIENDGASDLAAVRLHLSDFLGVPPPAISLSRIARLPLTSSGKKDYKALA